MFEWIRMDCSSLLFDCVFVAEKRDPLCLKKTLQGSVYGGF